MKNVTKEEGNFGWKMTERQVKPLRKVEAL